MTDDEYAAATGREIIAHGTPATGRTAGTPEAMQALFASA